MPSASVLSPLQALVFATLNNDTTLNGLLGSGRIFDYVPEQTVFPYVSLTDFRETPNDTLGTIGRDVEVTIEVWSQAEGFKEIEAVMNRIVVLLDNDALADATGWSTISSVYTVGDLVRESDGLTRHGMMMFTVQATQP